MFLYYVFWYYFDDSDSDYSEIESCVAREPRLEWYKKWSKEGDDQTIRARLGTQISTEKREKLREENGLEKQPND